jgi:hypothetical protein
MLSKLAAEYNERNGLTARTLRLNCIRWERVIGKDPSPESLQEFRSLCLARGLSPVTIEKTITDVLTVWNAQGNTLAAGKRLKRQRPEPHPVQIESINAIWPHAAHWFRRWLVLTYWTAARCEDSVRLYRMTTSNADCLRLKADKTGVSHVWPIPEWLRAWLILPGEHPLGGVSLHFTNKIRDGLTDLCSLAGVDRFTPQQLRQRSINEWTKANATAGQIVHGCGLGVMAHYLDPLSILESAAPRVRLPACFGVSLGAGQEDALLSNFRRLDPAGQGLVTMTLERLAAG